jgi:SsrA-binding protein
MSFEIVNRKAKFLYILLDKFEAGVILLGTEVKSVKLGNANLRDAYCYFKDGELFIRNLHISEYKFGNRENHDPRRERKLLLTKRELKKIFRKSEEKNLTIIPYRIFLNERGFIKIEIFLAQGKKSFDKRHSLKEKDMKREMDQNERSF